MIAAMRSGVERRAELEPRPLFQGSVFSPTGGSRLQRTEARFADTKLVAACRHSRPDGRSAAGAPEPPQGPRRPPSRLFDDVAAGVKSVRSC